MDFKQKFYNINKKVFNALNKKTTNEIIFALKLLRST